MEYMRGIMVQLCVVWCTVWANRQMDRVDGPTSRPPFRSLLACRRPKFLFVNSFENVQCLRILLVLSICRSLKFMREEQSCSNAQRVISIIYDSIRFVCGIGYAWVPFVNRWLTDGPMGEQWTTTWRMRQLFVLTPFSMRLVTQCTPLVHGDYLLWWFGFSLCSWEGDSAQRIYVCTGHETAPISARRNSFDCLLVFMFLSLSISGFSYPHS